MFSKFIHKDTITLRNYHILNKKNPKWFTLILLNPKLRKITKYILEKTSNYNLLKKINTKFLNKLFFYQIKIQKSKRFNFIDFKFTSRNCLVLKLGEKINVNKKVKNDLFYCFGINFLETIKYLLKDYYNYDFVINLKIFEKDKILDNFNLSLPLGYKKHSVSVNELGNTWHDFNLDLAKYEGKKIRIQKEINLKKKSLVLRKSNQIKNYSDQNIKMANKIVALSKPFYKNKNYKKKILLLVGESFTDPFYFTKFYKKKTQLDNFKRILDSSKTRHYKQAYSVADSTVPHIPSILTGLIPSQHGFGNYDLNFKDQILNENFKTLSQILKREYLSSYLFSEPYFDRLKGWGRDTHNYYNAENFRSEFAPESKKIINNFEFYKDTNTFIFCHFDLLHLPLLHNINKNYFENISVESLDKTYKNNFANLYADRFKRVNLEIGIIINYLIETNQYENTKIILTGDHGVAMPPNWGNDGFGSTEYAQYDEHIRVPLIIKDANWEDQNKSDPNEVVTTQPFIFEEIVKSTGNTMPNYLNSLPQFNYKNVGISETVFHPKENNYCVALSTKKFKYWTKMEMDWGQKKIIKTLAEKKFSINEDGFEKEINDKISNDEITNLKKISNEIISKGIDFQIQNKIN
jgi:hypothetical protein